MFQRNLEILCCTKCLGGEKVTQKKKKKFKFVISEMQMLGFISVMSVTSFDTICNDPSLPQADIVRFDYHL